MPGKGQPDRLAGPLPPGPGDSEGQASKMQVTNVSQGGGALAKLALHGSGSSRLQGGSLFEPDFTQREGVA